MASTQEAEIIFAQKLASNEKPIRSKALLKLRKYISVRSEKEQGGFSEDELLKIWKGLFYCLWMQDLPLLQEELSTKISGLLHSFRTVDSQFLYFKTFLQTMKREWNGIDRLRMDKVYQCVRFVFREAFEMLKRQDWNPSVVNEFLQLISEQLLQSSSSAPSGLVLHILDLYLNELALIGSATLTAEQNQTFIEPFCKAMAKNKDRVLLKAIGSNIFNTIVDQVPFAIEDLLREIRQNEGREPESEDEDEKAGKDQMKMKAEEDDDHEEDSSDLEDLSHEKDVKGEPEWGAVLQFDYGAIADRLFQLASYTNIPSFNRSKLYKFVKIFRDLSEGVFPQDEVEVVSSDEDDDDDNRRRRKKKKKRLNKQSQEKTDKDAEASEMTPESNPSEEKKKKRKKRRLKGVEDQTRSDVDRPMLETVDVPASKPLNTHKKKKAKGLEINEEQSKGMISITDPPKEQQDSSDLRPVKKQKKQQESEQGADEKLSDLSVVPPALQKKKRKLKKKKRDADDGETTSDCSQTDDTQTENCCAEIHTNPAAPDLSTVTTTLKKRKTKKTSTDDPSDVKEEKMENKMVKKSKIKKKAVRSEQCRESDETAETLHIDDKQSQSHEKTETNIVKKKKKQKSVELNGETNERVKRKRNLMNGHTEQESVKKPKILNESDKSSDQMKTKGFAFSPKKSPTALFCRSAGFITPVCKKKSLNISKSETKKVTFGLKNNKTMEFRKMDRSSLLSPAGQSQVAFDPKKTPKSGVLKSPTSSPAIRRRSTAADFF